MASFLTLVKDVERESGTMSTLITTTVGAAGRHLKFVTWVQQAWEDIQRERTDWSWMKARFEGTLSSGLDTYDPSLVGATRWARWEHFTPGGQDFSVYLTSAGRSDERWMQEREHSEFERTCRFGSNYGTQGYPGIVSVDPAGKLLVWPVPDAAYTLRGAYWKAPQALSADGDIPEMPERFHAAIRLRALLLMATHDEALDQVPVWTADYARINRAMVQDMTPWMHPARPLA